jgi:hypothetical protein
MGISRDSPLSGSRQWNRAPASLSRKRGAAGDASGRTSCGSDEACQLPHTPPLLRDASSGGRLRHPNDSGAAKAPGRIDDDDLYSRS